MSNVVDVEQYKGFKVEILQKHAGYVPRILDEEGSVAYEGIAEKDSLQACYEQAKKEINQHLINPDIELYDYDCGNFVIVSTQKLSAWELAEIVKRKLT